MKKVAACVMMVFLLLGCVPVFAEEADGLTEIRCDEWRFSVRIPSGTKAVPFAYENSEFETVDGGGLCVSQEGTDGTPRLWILRRDHAFNNPSLYLTDFFWQHLNEDSDEIFDEDGYDLFRYGGITLYGSGCRVYGENDEILYREFRFIPYRDDGGVEFVIRFTDENRDTAYALLDTVIRNYLPDEEPEKAEAKYRPIHQEADPENGTFRVRFEDVDRLKTDGYCTAVLCTTDHYTEEDLRSMRPGDTLQINGRVYTLTFVDPWELEDGSWHEVRITTKEQAPQQSLYGFTFEEDEFGEGYILYVMDDWYSVSPVASVRIDASDVIAHYDVPGGEDDPELLNENMLDSESGIRTLTQVAPYNTTCTLENGKLVRVNSMSYPVGPVDPFIPVD